MLAKIFASLLQFRQGALQLKRKERFKRLKRLEGELFVKLK